MHTKKEHTTNRISTAIVKETIVKLRWCKRVQAKANKQSTVSTNRMESKFSLNRIESFSFFAESPTTTIKTRLEQVQMITSNEPKIDLYGWAS